MDFVWAGSIKVHDVYRHDFTTEFLINFYIGIYLFAVGEVVPRTETEVYVACVIIFCSLIINAVLIGNMSVYMSELNVKNIQFQ
jgi:hypothetical protein